MFFIIANPYLILPPVDSVPPPGPRFELGRIVATPGALASIPPEETMAALTRHHRGDWGELDEHDRAENELSLKVGFRLFSVYHASNGVKFYIITEHDRSVTTVLLPEEY